MTAAILLAFAAVLALAWLPTWLRDKWGQDS